MPDLLGVMIGGAIALAGTVATKFWDQARDARALRSALRAEIQGLLEIAAARRHEEKARHILEFWRRGNDAAIKYYGSDLAMNDPVYDSNVGKIGVLGPKLAADIVIFYTRLRAVRITVRAFEEGALDDMSLDFRSMQIQEALDIWSSAIALAEDLIKKLS